MLSEELKNPGTVPLIQTIMYNSVMQSDGNSICGDDVLDNFNMVYRDKDSILDQNMRGK